MRATHSQKLERWLGADEVEKLSGSMKDWYGPPIAVGNVPGKVYACKGGDFHGIIEAGSEASIWDKAMDSVKRIQARADYSFERWMRKQKASPSLHGFTSLADLVSEASTAKRRVFTFNKTGAAGTTGASNTLWDRSPQPAAGAAAANAPGGTVPDSTTTGAMPFNNPNSGDTQHFVFGEVLATVAGNQLLLYDRLFSVNKTMSNSGTEAVTGVPTRYQGVSGGANGADGNFLFIEVVGALSATSHNWTTCLYTDQAGGASTLPSVTGQTSQPAAQFDQPINTWFCPLASGDSGIQTLTQMQCSSAVLTGTINFTMGHPIAWFPCPIANAFMPVDGLQSAFQLERIIDSACLALLEVIKPSGTVTTYTGLFKTVAG